MIGLAIPIDTRIYDPVIGVNHMLKEGKCVLPILSYFTPNKTYPVYAFKGSEIVTQNDKKEIVTVNDLYFLPENTVEVKNPENEPIIDLRQEVNQPRWKRFVVWLNRCLKGGERKPEILITPVVVIKNL